MGGIRGAVRDDWPVVGRDGVLAEIVAAFAHRGGTVLVGAGGVGRTRLAREAAARITGSATWAAVTRSAAATPLGALAHLVDTTDPVLVVDDAHLLDDASAALVHRMATGGPTFVLATVRAGRPAPDAVTALWTEEVVPRIDVGPLADAEIRGLLHVDVGHLDALSEQVLVRLADGNPLLLRELLLAGRTTGTLRRDEGVWRWTGTDYVTPRLTDVILTRIGGLDRGTRAVVEVLACAGDLPVAVVEELAGAEAVAEAERRELVAVARSGARLVARLAHLPRRVRGGDPGVTPAPDLPRSRRGVGGYADAPWRRRRARRHLAGTRRPPGTTRAAAARGRPRDGPPRPRPGRTAGRGRRRRARGGPPAHRGPRPPWTVRRGRRGAAGRRTTRPAQPLADRRAAHPARDRGRGGRDRRPGRRGVARLAARARRAHCGRAQGRHPGAGGHRRRRHGLGHRGPVRRPARGPRHRRHSAAHRLRGHERCSKRSAPARTPAMTRSRCIRRPVTTTTRRS